MTKTAKTVKTALTQEQKVDIVVNFLESVDPVKSTFAKSYNISPSSLTRYVEQYGAEARKVMKTRTKQSTAKDGRGYKGRNGRVEIIYSSFAKLGLDADMKDVVKEINAKSVKYGLKPLRESTAVAMSSVARRALKENPALMKA